jgi:hypothetical protein
MEAVWLADAERQPERVHVRGTLLWWFKGDAEAPSCRRNDCTNARQAKYG